MSVKSCTPADRALGRAIRDARISRKISQQTVAAALGVTFPQVQKYEGGTNRLTVTRLVDLAAALGVSAHDLLDVVIATHDDLTPSKGANER